MGLETSTMKTLTVDAAMIHELCQDKLVYATNDRDYPLAVLYFDPTIADDCYRILSDIKENGGQCDLDYDHGRVREICEKQNIILTFAVIIFSVVFAYPVIELS